MDTKTETFADVLYAQLRLAEATGEPFGWAKLADMVRTAQKAVEDLPGLPGGPTKVEPTKAAWCASCGGTGGRRKAGSSTWEECPGCEGTGVAFS